MSDVKAIFKFDRSQVMVMGVAVVMLVCFILLVCVPGARKMGAIEQKSAEAEKQWELQKADIEALPEVSKRVADLKEQAAALAVKVPAEPRLPQFLGAVADVLSKAGARQHEIVPQVARTADKYVALPVDVKFEATYRAALGILSGLESMDRANTVENLKMSKVPGENEWIAVELRLVVYHTLSAAKQPVTQVAASGQGRVH